jgi:hypothetical protein
MAQIITFDTTATTITGTILNRDGGGPERFAGFSLARSRVAGAITSEGIAAALGLSITDPVPPSDVDLINAATALLPEGYEIVPAEAAPLAE